MKNMTLLRGITAMITLLFTVEVSPANSAWTEVTVCTALKGSAYFFSGGAVPESKAGLAADAISEGSTTLLRQGEEFDIIYRDAANRQRSVRFHEKATIIAIGNIELFTILVVHERRSLGTAIEQYTFQLDNKGQGLVVLTQQKHTVLISKTSMMIGKCHTP